MRDYDVCGLGNAIVDIFLELDDSEFASLAFERGTMRLVDADEQSKLLHLFSQGHRELRIAHNKLLRYYRTQGVESSARVKLGMPDRSALSAMDAARIDELIDLEERGRAVRHALAQLPQPEQDALTLRVVEMRAYREIAGLLGCTEQAARARVCRGLQKLNRLLPSEGTL